MIKPHAPRWLKILAAAYAAYLALVLVVGTPLLNVLAPKFYRQHTGAELKLDKIIWLNPFTLSTTIQQASSANTDQSPFWAFDELGINISLTSLWRGHLVLDSLALRGANVQIQQLSDERFNFSDIIDYRSQHFPQPQASPTTAVKDTASEPFAIEIDKFEFSAKHLSYRAPNAPEPVNATLGDVSFILTQLSTVTDKSKISDTTALVLQGSDLHFEIKTINLEFLREKFSFTTALHDLKINYPEFSTVKNSEYELSVLDSKGGKLNIKGAIDLAQRSANGRAVLQAMSVLPAWQYLAHKLAFDMHDTKLDAETDFVVDWANANTKTDSLRYRLDNAALALSNVQLQARHDSSSHLGFGVLKLNRIQVDSAQPSVHISSVLIDKLNIAGWNKDQQISLIDMFALPNDESSEPSPWQIKIDDIAVQNSELRWHASQLDHLPLTLAPLDIHLTNLHWPDDAPVQIDAKTTLNNTALLTVNGAITSNSQSGELLANVSGLPLVWGDIFVRQQMRATITDGALSASAKINLDRAQVTSVKSDGAIDQFELHPLLNQSTDTRKLVTWKKLEWKQLTLDPKKQRLAIQQVVASQPWAQFRINTDGTNNFQQLMVDAPPTDNVKLTRTPAQQRNDSADNSWQVAVANIHIDHAAIDFRDASLTSAFRTNITELSGDISNIDTSARRTKNNVAKVALKGTVDGYAPVAISGTVNPFALQPELNITLDITNLDLASLTPYSGTYAGYHIDGGRLSVQMAYTLENNRVKGSNHIVVNQMQLGKQVSGPKVMDMPLRLAMYLLTDSQGVMDLGVDVTGDVDDPDFSVSSIIWKAFRNLIVKTVASPFKALARATGSNRDDLDHIDFILGSSQFAAGEHEKLDALQQALEKKSALKINIMGHVSPSRDLEALRDNTLSAQLIAQGGIKPVDIEQQSKNWQREVSKLFKVRFPEEKNPLEVMQMNDAMRDNIELPPSALQDLAAERALALKQALVTEHGLAADRAFVKPTDLGADKTPGPFATLAVE